MKIAKSIQIICILTLILVSGCSTSETIKVGAVYPLSGMGAEYGTAWKRATDLAVERFESENQVDVEIIYEDSLLEPSKAVTAVQKLIYVDEVRAIIPGSSSEMLAIAPIVEENKVLMVGIGSAPEITHAGDYVFRVYPSDLYQGKDIANFIEYDSIAILAVQSEYGFGLKNVIKDTFNGDVVAVETFVKEETDFKTQLNKIKEANPDALVLIAYNHYPTILRQLKELNINLPIFASENFISLDLEVFGELAEDVIFPLYVEPKSYELDKFLAFHRNRFNAEPGPFATGFYDATLIILDALHNSETNEEAKDYLYNLNDWKGITGITNFDENGDVIGKSYTLMQVINNTVTEINS